IYGPRSPAFSACGTAALPSSAPSVGVKKSATASEADSVAISVIGRDFMNWPTTPGQNRSGEKAARGGAGGAMTGPDTRLAGRENAAMRVAVAAITGPDMRLAASE